MSERHRLRAVELATLPVVALSSFDSRPGSSLLWLTPITYQPVRHVREPRRESYELQCLVSGFPEKLKMRATATSTMERPICYHAQKKCASSETTSFLRATSAPRWPWQTFSFPYSKLSVILKTARSLSHLEKKPPMPAGSMDESDGPGAENSSRRDPIRRVIGPLRRQLKATRDGGQVKLRSKTGLPCRPRGVH